MCCAPASYDRRWSVEGYRKIKEGFEAERMEIPSCKELCGGLLVTIKRPDLDISNRNGGNAGGNAGGNVGGNPRNSIENN